MPIQIQCPGCGTAFRVNDNAAGKRVKCRNCGGAIQVAANHPPPALDAFPQDLLSSPNLLAPPPSSQPLNWGGAGGYAGSHSTPPRSRAMIVLAALGLVWAGFAVCDSVDRINDLWPHLRLEPARAVLSVGLAFSLRSLQTACVVAVVVAIAAMTQQRAWGAPLGAMVSTANAGISAAWLPLLSTYLGMVLFVQGGVDLGISDLFKFIVRIVVDIIAYLVVPALLVIGFRRQVSSKSWRKKGRASTLLLAAVTLGWSIFASIQMALLLAAFSEVFEKVDMFDFSVPRADALAKFWIMILAKAGCLLAALVLLAAAAGMFLRQHWANLTALIASGAYVVLDVVALVVAANLPTRMNSSGVNLRIIPHLVFLLIPAAAIAVWCLISKDEEG